MYVYICCGFASYRTRTLCSSVASERNGSAVLSALVRSSGHAGQSAATGTVFSPPAILMRTMPSADGGASTSPLTNGAAASPMSRVDDEPGSHTPTPGTMISFSSSGSSMAAAVASACTRAAALDVMAKACRVGIVSAI